MPSKKIAEEIARVRASDPKLRTLTVEFHPVDFLGFSEALAVNKSLESLAIEFNFFEAKSRGSVDTALREHKSCQGLYYGEAFKADAGGPSREALTDLLVALVAESGRPGRAELLAKKGRIGGGVGCPPNCRTSGKLRGSLGEAPTF